MLAGVSGGEGTREKVRRAHVCEGRHGLCAAPSIMAGSKRRADAALNGEVGGGRNTYKKAHVSQEPSLNPEETLQAAVFRLDNVKACM